MTTTTTTTTTTSERPWPVVLLTALGAWLATIPLAGVVALLLGDLLVSGIGPYVVAPLLLVGAGVVLRAQGVGTFVEQMAVPLLLLGGVALGFGLYRDLSMLGASLVLAVVALGAALMVRGAWLQALLGACAVGLLMVGLGTRGTWSLWLPTHAAVLFWTLLAAGGTRQRSADRPLTPSAATLDAIGTGWLLATLAALAFSSGTTFLVEQFAGTSWPARGSVALAAAGVALLWHRLPALRRPWWIGVMAGALVLAGFMPWLGAAWWLAACCLSAHQPRRAAAAALAAVWIIGAFYYTLDWPLATKAAVLAGTGTLLGLLAWWGLHTRRTATAGVAEPAAAPGPDRARRGIALSALAVLAVANVGIWQKEDLIAHGRTVYIALAPVDPRSLMQGDYMALNYQLGDTLRDQLDDADRLTQPVALARLDARGVATLEQLVDTATDAPPSADRLHIRLAPRKGRWVIVSDAWFFREGEGERWQAARYGEFRVQPDGRALLVGLADADLQPIRPLPLTPAATAPPPPAASPAPALPASGG